MKRALTVTLLAWAVCAYAMYSYRRILLAEPPAALPPVEDAASPVERINAFATAAYGKHPTWHGEGKFEIGGEAAEFEVMFMAVPARVFEGHPEKETSFLGRLFFRFRGKVYDITDDSQYARDLTYENGRFYLHWPMPDELHVGLTAIRATLPDEASPHFMVRGPDGEWTRSVYIQWEKMNDTAWFETFDRQLARAER